jgi:hypothetical protein
MPLGNGDVGLNVRVENNCAPVFHVSKIGGFDGKHLPRNLGGCG